LQILAAINPFFRKGQNMNIAKTLSILALTVIAGSAIAAPRGPINAKKITKAIKDAKLKVTVAIRSEEVRVSGKSIDDLQECIRLVKGLNLELPISFKNLK